MTWARCSMANWSASQKVSLHAADAQRHDARTGRDASPLARGAVARDDAGAGRAVADAALALVLRVFVFVGREVLAVLRVVRAAVPHAVLQIGVVVVDAGVDDGHERCPRR